MPKEFIVAIELGSSKITGIAGRKNLDGSITVLATVEEDSSSCIKKGVIYNINQTCLCLTNIIKKLKATLKQEIKQVYVGVGGRSIRSVKNVIAKDLPDNTVISQSVINELMDANRNMAYPDQEILDAITQEYKIDNQHQLEPVGIQCSHLEGVFLNILWRKTFYNNINTCLENANIAIADMYLAPLAMADSVLTDSEKRAGCLLVDLGADTTTVSVYYKGILRHLSVIPIGGSNITKDIASLQVEEQDAEKMKIKYAHAFTENSNIDPTLNYSIDKDRVVESKKFIEIVEARVQEIVENAWYQVPVEFADKLLGGIILTGGGSNMPDIDKVFRKHTHIEKIRIAKFINQTVNSKDPRYTNHDGSMNTVLGLLAKGDMNCAGEEVNNDLFTAQDERVTGAEVHKAPRTPNETVGTGVVLTAAEKQAAEDEARRKKEAEDEAARKAAEEEAARIAEEKKQKSVLHRGMRFVKKFLADTISEEE